MSSGDHSLPSPPPPSAAPVRKERPKWRPLLILICGGLALALGGCQYFTRSYMHNDTGALIGASAFVIGSVSVVVGGLAALVHSLRVLFR